MNLTVIINIIATIIVLKALTIGSDFNFYLFIKYGKEYWNWYKNRPDFPRKNIKKNVKKENNHYTERDHNIPDDQNPNAIDIYAPNFDPFNCPICGEDATYSCKCPKLDSICRNGHEWHICLVHNKKVLGPYNHISSTMKCSCYKD